MDFKNSMNIDVVVLAAGQGSRMKSDLPKVLHPIAGKSMLAHVLDCARSVEANNLHVVVGHGSEVVKTCFNTATDIQWALQTEQKGTGHAVKMALDNLAPSGVTLILYGDVPLIQSNTLQQLIKLASPSQMSLLTVNIQDPPGYGSIVLAANEKVSSIF